MLIPDITGLVELIEPTLDDPVLSRAELPLHATHYPLGFPLELSTNSPAVLAAAQRSWGLFRPRFPYPPLTLRIGVTSSVEDSADLPPAPRVKLHNGLLASIADANNFVIADFNNGFSFGWLTERAVESMPYFRYHFLEAAALCMVAALRAVALHAACVVPFGHGMLLCGDSGAGKSSLAFAGARAGWTFVCDDASYLPFHRDDRMVLGNCHQFRLRDSAVQIFPDLEGRSLTPRATGKPSIEIPTSDFPELLTAGSANVQSIVFLNRHNVETPELIPYSREMALAWFSQFPLTTAESHASQITAIQHLLEVPVYEMRYTDLDWAIDRLETLAQDGR